MANRRKPLRRILEALFILSVVACTMLVFQQKSNLQAEEKARLEAEKEAQEFVEKTAVVATEFVKTAPVAFVEGLKIVMNPEVPTNSQSRMRLSMLDRQLEKDPGNTALLSERSWAHYALGDYELALADLDRLLQHEPNNVGWLNNRAYFLAKTGCYQEALPDALRSVELSQASHNLDTLAYIHVGLGNYKEAVNAYENALKIEPEKVHALRGRAVAYRQLGELEKSQADLDKQKSLDSDFCLHWEIEPDPGEHDDDKSVLLAE